MCWIGLNNWFKNHFLEYVKWRCRQFYGLLHLKRYNQIPNGNHREMHVCLYSTTSRSWPHLFALKIIYFTSDFKTEDYVSNVFLFWLRFFSMKLRIFHEDLSIHESAKFYYENWSWKKFILDVTCSFGFKDLMMCLSNKYR